MEAQRAAMGGRRRHPQTIQSYEPDCPVVLLVVETDEGAAHEAHVGVEVVRSRLAGIKVRSFARENHVSVRNHAAEVGDQ